MVPKDSKTVLQHFYEDREFTILSGKMLHAGIHLFCHETTSSSGEYDSSFN